jgi:hypothetical protein
LADNSRFWNFTAALLLGICRQRQISFDPPVMSARSLSDELLGLI